MPSLSLQFQSIIVFRDQYDINVSIIQLLEEIKVLQDCKGGHFLDEIFDAF